MRLAAHTTVIAAALAAAAIASPLASARPLEPPTTTGRTQSTGTAPAVRPTSIQLATHVGELVPPILPAATASQPPEVRRDEWAASQAFAHKPPTSAGAIGRPALLPSLAQQERQRVAALAAYREGQLAAAFDVAATAANKASVPQAVVRVHAPQSGFDWGDAGLGAAGGLVISLLVLGGGFLVTQRRHTTPSRTKALA